MTSRPTIERITGFCVRRPWLTVLVWVIIIATAAYLIVNHLPQALTTSQELISRPESTRATESLETNFPDRPKNAELVIVTSTTLQVGQAEYRNFVQDLVETLTANINVERVINFYQLPEPSLVSEDQSALLIPVTLKGKLADQENSVGEIITIAHQKQTTNFEVKVSGSAAINRNFSEASEKDLKTGEIYGLPVALVILLVVFGAVTTALIPLVMSIIAIVVAIGATALVGTLGQPLSIFVVNMITMMGLAVGIDYSLFVISRFREERRAGVEKVAAVMTAGTTAGRTVMSSGLIVVLALAGLFLVPINIFQGLAAGAALVVVASVLAALTLLPALLSLLGDRINWLSFGSRQSTTTKTSSAWDSIIVRVIKWPVASLLIAVALLLVASIPLLDLRIGASGIGSMPESFEARQAYDLLSEKFSVGLVSTAYAVIEGDLTDPAIKDGVQRFQQEITELDSLGPSTIEISANNQAAAVRFSINAETTSDQAATIIDNLRHQLVPSVFKDLPARVLIGGDAADNIDFVDIARDNAVKVFSFVLGLSFLLLMIIFRSVVVPIKAILMNLLSVSAAYGLLVLMFQKGWGQTLFGFQQVDKIEAWLPLFLFCVLFGLSMDYHVFLLSRIREKFSQSGNNTEAVIFGVRSTAGLITGAALIMVAVFASFAAGDLVMFQQMGFGMAVAILIDATIVRIVLVPASMQLLGKLNWYLPRFLHWLPNWGGQSD